MKELPKGWVWAKETLIIAARHIREKHEVSWNARERKVQICLAADDDLAELTMQEAVNLVKVAEIVSEEGSKILPSGVHRCDDGSLWIDPERAEEVLRCLA